MSKLHFYKNSTKEADGDGTTNKDGFSATISWGEVKKGHTYEVRQGTKTSGDNYPCTTGATKDGTAKFGKKE
ncbi:hypothetical protein [Tenacibaculum sp. 190524A02b]|uniref:Uncharacterized protein n=1 Tax=Tenacibaculum vairaonense TaxID=3137860 RepID=A0ABP1FDU1_9FLAO